MSATDHFPAEIHGLPRFDGPIAAHRLAAEACDVLFATYPAGTNIPPHDHPTNNVGVITKGRLWMSVDNVETAYEVGDWYHLPPGTAHAARFDDDSALIEFWFEH